MKFLLMFIILISQTTFAQSKFGFEVGLDSLAKKLNIKKKTELRIQLVNNRIDTVVCDITEYDMSGYITSMKTQYQKCHFRYNEAGYLVSESQVYTRGPGFTSYKKDTLTITESSTTLYFDGNNQVQNQSKTYCYSSSLDSSIISRFYTYNPDGSTHTINTFDEVQLISIETFYYLNNGILTDRNRVMTDGDESIIFYQYEYY